MEIAFDGFQEKRWGLKWENEENSVIPSWQCVDFTILIEKLSSFISSSSFKSDFIPPTILCL